MFTLFPGGARRRTFRLRQEFVCGDTDFVGNAGFVGSEFALSLVSRNHGCELLRVIVQARPKFWAIRQWAHGVTIDRAASRIFISVRRAAKMKPGDGVVLLSPLGEALAFSATAQIREVEVLVSEEDGGPRRTLLRLGDWAELTEPITLEDLRYSLTVVRNPRYPKSSFRRSHRLMPEQDFRTILDGEIFLARTSYFEILEALPLELRRDFEFAELSNRAQSPFDRLFRDKLERLMQFVEDRVLVAGRLLIELANAIDVNVLESDSMSPIVHAFCDDGAEAPGKTHLPDRIRLQASRFAEYFAITGASPSSVGSVEESRALVELALALRTRSQLPREDVFERAFEQFA